MFAWKPGGRLVVFQPTSSQLIDGVATVMATDADVVTPSSVDVAEMVTVLGLAATPVTADRSHPPWRPRRRSTTSSSSPSSRSGRSHPAVWR